MATPVADAVGLTGNPYIDGLLQGSQWQFGGGPRVLTYSLNANFDLDQFGNITFTGSNWSESLATNVAMALQAWSNVANISFQLISSGTFAMDSTADMAVTATATDLQQLGIYALSLFPDPDFASLFLTELGSNRSQYPRPEGDLYFDNILAGGFAPGSFGFAILLHEIGHALGLKHTYDDGGNLRPSFSHLGVQDFDDLPYTLMGEGVQMSTGVTSPLLLDVQAIQYLYGANMSYRTGDDMYTLTSAPAGLIWDAGGVDTIDATSHFTGVKIDLHAGEGVGALSDIARMRIAYGVTIENATGSAYSDLIIGNDANNVLNGGPGGGSDTLRGGKGDDTYILAWSPGTVEELPNEGTDTLVAEFAPEAAAFPNVERFVLSGVSYLGFVGDGRANYVVGNSGGNAMLGNEGNDTLLGGLGDDTLDGGAGADRLEGGAGNDRYVVTDLDDALIELPGEGVDEVVSSSISFSLPEHIENAVLLGAAPINATGNAAANHMQGNFGDNVLSGLDGDDSLFGSSGHDTLYGGNGDDTLDGGDGVDHLEGGAGNDRYVIEALSDQVIEYAGGGIDTVMVGFDYALGDQIENLQISGAVGTGNDAANVLAGGTALYGRGGNDTLSGSVAQYGEAGDDRLVGDDAFGVVADLVGGPGNDAYTSTTRQLYTYSLTLTGAPGNPLLDGTSDHVESKQGEYAWRTVQDAYEGVAGAPDFFEATIGEWHIRFYTYPANRSIAPGFFEDTQDQNPYGSGQPAFFDVYSSTRNVQTQSLPMTADVTVVKASFEQPNYFYGMTALRLEFEAFFDGYAAALTGELSFSDRPYMLIEDRILELPDEGNDTLMLDASVKWTNALDLAGTNVENVTVTGPGEIMVVGTADVNRLIGNAAANTLWGEAGDDTLDGGEGDDALRGGAGNDALEGGAGSDTVDYLNAPAWVLVDLLHGAASRDGEGGIDTLSGIEGVLGSAFDDLLIGDALDNAFDGAGGIDRIVGGQGNDTFVVDGQWDLVFEDANGGIDTITSTASFYLYRNIENLTLAGSASYGVGNELSNAIAGNSQPNLLIGWGGNDTLDAGHGNDLLFGVDGNDVLYGGSGIDYLAAGNGNDTIYGGNDADEAYGEDGSDLIYGGDDFATDILVGGAGNDTIDGGQAWDLMYGGAGDDTFYVSQQVDWVFEQPGEGTDTVIADSPNGYYLYANIENLELAGVTSFGVGNELANALTGNAVTNLLLGGSGNDRLNGKGGNDVLFGEGGADTFVFERGTGGDVIGDFAPGTDKIELSGVGYASYAQVQSHLVENGGTAAIDLGAGDFVVINGVGIAQLSATDFAFA